jgi:outer membrane protein
MKPLKIMILMPALGVMLAAAPALAQTTAQQPPAQQPPAQQPPAQQQPPAKPPLAPAPQPPAKPAAPAPFPEGAKIAYVDIQAIASNSAEGKAATARLDDLKKKKNAELVTKGNQLKAAQDKLQQGGSVMNDQAMRQLQKDIERMQREIDAAQQDAQNEVNEMTQDLQNEFQEKLNPIIEELRKEKGLQLIFSMRDSGLVAGDPGLDLSAEVIKRFDAASKAGPKK